ncbi:MAG TPA: hypothetical protein VIZ17_18145 [Acetobacteraceae bacterium]
MSLPATTTDLDPTFLDHLLDTILGSIPTRPDDTEQTRATRRHAARLALLALKPADPFAAMLAAQAIAAHYAVMDNLRRAAQPEVPDATATRLRGNAATLTRTMHATLRALHKHQAPPAEPATPRTTQPRGRQLKPEQPLRPLFPAIPLADPEHAPPSRPYRRVEDMTLAERRAHYGYKGDPSVTANAPAS